MSTLSSLRYVAESAAEQLRVAEERWRPRCDCHKYERQVCDVCQGVTGDEKDVDVRQSAWGPRNNGDTTSFYSCGICGASVQPMDRETHIEWHRRVS